MSLKKKHVFAISVRWTVWGYSETRRYTVIASTSTSAAKAAIRAARVDEGRHRYEVTSLVQQGRNVVVAA